jgi:hypothetical protein
VTRDDVNNNNNNNYYYYYYYFRLVLGTELSAKNNIQAIGSLEVPVLRYSFGIINWHQEETAKARTENEETTNHSRKASPKGRCRSLVCSQKTGKKGPDAVRSSPRSRNYKTGGICRHEGRPTNTGCQHTNTAPTQQCYRQLDDTGQKYREKQEI